MRLTARSCFLNINAIKHIRFWAGIGNFPRPVPYIHWTQESSSLNLQISMTLFRWHQQSQWWRQGRCHLWLLRCQWLDRNYVYRMKFQIINEISWYALALRSLMVWCGPAKSCGTWRAKHPFPLSLSLHRPLELPMKWQRLGNWMISSSVVFLQSL